VTSLGASRRVRLSAARWWRLPEIPRPRAELPALVLAVLASALTGALAAVTGGWKVPGALLALVGLASLGVLRPRFFLGMFVLLRPLVALVSSKQLIPGLASANANGLTGLLLLVVLLAMALTARSMFTPRATPAFAALLTASAIATAWAIVGLHGKAGGDPISELVRLMSLAAMYLLAANLFDTVARSRLLLKLFALSGVAPATIGVVEWASGSASYRAQLGVSRIGSTLGGGSNTLAAYLAATALIMIAGRTGLPRWLRWSTSALMVAALVGTYSREGWLIFMLGLIALGWRRQRMLVLGVLAVTGVLVFAVPSIHDRLLPAKTRVVSGHSETALTSFNWRLHDWSELWGKVTQSPLVGYGLGTELYVNPYLNAYEDYKVGWNSHNSGLTILIEGGVALLLFWIVLFTSMLRVLREMARCAWELAHAASLTSALWIAVIVAGLATEDTLDETTLVFIMLALTGSLEAARRSRRAERAELAERLRRPPETAQVRPVAGRPHAASRPGALT